MMLGVVVVAISFSAFAVRFSEEQEMSARRETEARLAGNLALESAA